MKKILITLGITTAAALAIGAGAPMLCKGIPKVLPAETEPGASDVGEPAQKESSPVPAAGAPDDSRDTIHADGPQTYPVVDTAQDMCFGNTAAIKCPPEKDPFFGQDAQYAGHAPSYRDNSDGTVTDIVTGLMWGKDAGEKIPYRAAIEGASSFTLAGYKDWRVPSIKELYSLMDFRGVDPSSMNANPSGLVPFIDRTYFDFIYGNTADGSRVIDSQWVTSNTYVSTVMNSQECFFGVNFADGRIKCYPTADTGRNRGYFVRYVRGKTYGQNKFTDNGNGTVTDAATGLTWQKDDSGRGMFWKDALSYCENLALAQKDDWRLPNAKELQSIVDYTRSPDTTHSAAIDPLFNSTAIENEAGKKDWPFYWSSTTHANQRDYRAAAYVAFGRALGYMQEFGGWIDVHGAGAQRSDDKTGDPNDYPTGLGPQGDARRFYNYVRCVRGGATFTTNTAQPAQPSAASKAPVSSQLPTRGMPPQEAVDACMQKEEGSPCTFSTPQGTRTGTCRRTPENAIACVP